MHPLAIFQDVRYALRQMRRAPAFAVTAVLTLGIIAGIFHPDRAGRMRADR